MSRIGAKPIPIPQGVEIEQIGKCIRTKGPLGSLEFNLPEGISVNIEDRKIFVRRSGDSKTQKAAHGLSRSIIANMIKGVTEGFSKTLEINGFGYRAQLQGNRLVLQLGYSHPVIYEIPPTIKIEVEKQTILKISGIDKQLVGEVAATIRRFRPPEPYKGTGIKYIDEHIRRKAGKAATATK